MNTIYSCECFWQLSKTITSEEGRNSGLIDEITSSSELLNVSRRWALDIAERRKPWLRTLHRTDKLGSLAEARNILKAARQQAKQIARNMPQHQACLDVIEEGVVHGGYSGILRVIFVYGARMQSALPQKFSLGNEIYL